MNPVIAIVDDCFYYPDSVRGSLLDGAYTDYISPVDSVSYPYIQKNLDGKVYRQMVDAIERAMGSRIMPNYLFSRAMPGGVKAPHKIHSDRDMGAFSAHVYMSKEYPHGAGTSFWTHKELGPTAVDSTEPSQFDSNEVSQWERYMHVDAKYNRMIVHHAAPWHQAEPTSGFGDKIAEFRIVISCFFDVF